ncbi:hypothetical protein DFH09DRAFT_1318824 [Mycena vulgaris]|nr:hypothetical protein DFH09DRAFT_1318824 [Mycena vulgaris]
MDMTVHLADTLRPRRVLPATTRIPARTRHASCSVLHVDAAPPTPAPMQLDYTCTWKRTREGPLNTRRQHIPAPLPSPQPLTPAPADRLAVPAPGSHLSRPGSHSEAGAQPPSDGHHYMQHSHHAQPTNAALTETGSQILRRLSTPLPAMICRPPRRSPLPARRATTYSAVEPHTRTTRQRHPRANSMNALGVLIRRPPAAAASCSQRVRSARSLGAAPAALVVCDANTGAELARSPVQKEGDRRLQRIARAGKQWKRTMGTQLIWKCARLWADDREAMAYK